MRNAKKTNVGRPLAERPSPSLRSRSQRRRPTRPVLGILLATCCVLALSCSNSPTDPGQSLVLEGNLEYQGRQFHSVTPGGDRVVRIEVLELTPVLIQVGGSTAPVLSVGVALGRPLNDVCATTASFSVGVGDKLSFSLADGDEHCVQIFDTGSLPVDATIHYVVLADVS